MLRISNNIPLLNTIDSIQKRYKKGYCYPSQEKLVALLGQFHSEFFSIRTLNRRLRRLETDGYLKRKRRLRATPDGFILFQSTIYSLTRKAYLFIGSLVRRLSHHTKKVSNWLIQKESPSISVEIPGPDEGRLLAREEVVALVRGLLKDVA